MSTTLYPPSISSWCCRNVVCHGSSWIDQNLCWSTLVANCHALPCMAIAATLSVFQTSAPDQGPFHQHVNPQKRSKMSTRTQFSMDAPLRTLRTQNHPTLPPGLSRHLPKPVANQLFSKAQLPKTPPQGGPSASIVVLWVPSQIQHCVLLELKSWLPQSTKCSPSTTNVPCVGICHSQAQPGTAPTSLQQNPTSKIPQHLQRLQHFQHLVLQRLVSLCFHQPSPLPQSLSSLQLGASCAWEQFHLLSASCSPCFLPTDQPEEVLLERVPKVWKGAPKIDWQEFAWLTWSVADCGCWPVGIYRLLCVQFFTSTRFFPQTFNINCHRFRLSICFSGPSELPWPPCCVWTLQLCIGRWFTGKGQVWRGWSGFLCYARFGFALQWAYSAGKVCASCASAKVLSCLSLFFVPIYLFISLRFFYHLFSFSLLLLLSLLSSSSSSCSVSSHAWSLSALSAMPFYLLLSLFLLLLLFSFSLFFFLLPSASMCKDSLFPFLLRCWFLHLPLQCLAGFKTKSNAHREALKPRTAQSRPCQFVLFVLLVVFHCGNLLVCFPAAGIAPVGPHGLQYPGSLPSTLQSPLHYPRFKLSCWEHLTTLYVLNVLLINLYELTFSMWRHWGNWSAWHLVAEETWPRHWLAAAMPLAVRPIGCVHCLTGQLSSSWAWVQGLNPGKEESCLQKHHSQLQKEVQVHQLLLVPMQLPKHPRMTPLTHLRAQQAMTLVEVHRNQPSSGKRHSSEKIAQEAMEKKPLEAVAPNGWASQDPGPDQSWMTSGVHLSRPLHQQAATPRKLSFQRFPVFLWFWGSAPSQLSSKLASAQHWRKAHFPAAVESRPGEVLHLWLRTNAEAKVPSQAASQVAKQQRLSSGPPQRKQIQ